jgi:gluconolactonase
VRAAARALAGLAALVAAAAPGAAQEIVRLDPRFDAIVPPGAVLEKLADGFAWLEGPVWEPRTGELLFSDVVQNTVFRWREGEGATRHLAPSGYTGSAPFAGREPGANGLALDPLGRLGLCQHGDRRIARLEAGRFVPLVDRFEGKRLNSPNDLVFRANGELWFTDPPFGLAAAHADPARELAWTGVYRVPAGGGAPMLAVRDLSAPNGLGFSPAEDVLYVSNADRARPVWMAYPVRADGSLGPGRVFFDGSAWVARWPGVPDGLDVDAAGNVFAAAPGGIHVLASDGAHLGSLVTGVATANSAFAEGGSALFVTAGDTLWRVRLRPQPQRGPSSTSRSRTPTDADGTRMPR